MEVLCFDMGSGGVRGARCDEQLRITALEEASWDIQHDPKGHATLSAYDIECAFADVAHRLSGKTQPAAVCIGCFMHSFLVLSSCCAALTPVFTWMDTSGSDGIDTVRKKFGNRFHERTGCHYHPMFPVFKLAANPPGRGNRVGSPKAWLIWELTGSFVEDFGMASASGLFDVRSGNWDPDLLYLAGLEMPDVPAILNPYSIAGAVTDAGATRFRIPAGIPLVTGSGDGFLANVGSACTIPKRMAVTLGTSAVARQMVHAPSLNPNAGTFCYRASTDSFLLGCASSNGGNVLDWARETFGPVTDVDAATNLPIFFPWKNGERSLEWDPELREKWYGRDERNTPKELSRAVAEGVLFNIAQYVDVIERESGEKAEDIVISGNGFLDPLLAPLLASILGRDLRNPKKSGLASLRGAAVHAWRALGHDPSAALEKLVAEAQRVIPGENPALQERFTRFKQLRRAS